MKNSNVIGIDLAKNVLQVCVINKHGELKSNKAMNPNKLREVLTKAKPSLVALEGCGSAHYWARYAQGCGHEVRMISPRRVKAFLQGQKTDANDAFAITIAASVPGMVFSQIKNIDQQILQTLETSRKFLDKEYTALSNHIRAFLYEYGIVTNKGKKALREKIVLVLDDEEKGLPISLKSTLRLLTERLNDTANELKRVTKDKGQIVKQIEPCKRLLDIEGVGEVGASMLYASLGDGGNFKNGRQAAAYIGLTPKQHSSGGKVVMLGIGKYLGDKQLKAVLFQGAMSVVCKLPSEPKTLKQAWLIAMVQRIGIKRTCIALCNKTVRTAWALLSSGERYRPIAISD